VSRDVNGTDISDRPSDREGRISIRIVFFGYPDTVPDIRSDIEYLNQISDSDTI
jgi:hypothetical protein